MEFGNGAQVRNEVASALPRSSTTSVRILAALALARAGDTDRAQKMADDLQKENPLNTMINGYWLPTIRAAVEISRKNPKKAIQILEAAAPYELGIPAPSLAFGATLYPVYLRGQAYLTLRQGSAAAGEFQKYVDHRTVVNSYPLGRWPASALPAPMPCSTTPRPALLTRISSLSGRTPTRASQS